MNHLQIINIHYNLKFTIHDILCRLVKNIIDHFNIIFNIS